MTDYRIVEQLGWYYLESRNTFMWTGRWKPHHLEGHQWMTHDEHYAIEKLNLMSDPSYKKKVIDTRIGI